MPCLDVELEETQGSHLHFLVLYRKRKPQTHTADVVHFFLPITILLTLKNPRLLSNELLKIKIAVVPFIGIAKVRKITVVL